MKTLEVGPRHRDRAFAEYW